jgi:hypothetical protein
MCTVLLRLRREAAWPLLMAAVRDEFLERPWDPPAAHWPDHPSIVGGRDRTAGGTWLAVDPSGPTVAAILNGVRLPFVDGRPSRGALPLAALAGTLPASFAGYDGFHLLRGTPSAVEVWSWDGASAEHRVLPPGDHIVVNEGVNAASDPLVPYFAPLLSALPSPALGPSPGTEAAWGPWASLLKGDGLALDDPRALIIRLEHEGHVYGSGSLALVALAPDAVRYDFSPTPLEPKWTSILPAAGSRRSRGGRLSAPGPVEADPTEPRP